DSEVGVGAELTVAVLQLLADHDQRHQVQLKQVADEKPEHERGTGIESELGRANRVTGEPEDRPRRDQEEESHRADAIGDPDRQVLDRREAAFELSVDVRLRPEPGLDLGELRDPVRCALEGLYGHGDPPDRRSWGAGSTI